LQAVRNAFQEFNIEANLDRDYLAEPFTPINGLIEVPNKPGLGAELDIELIESTLQVVK